MSSTLAPDEVERIAHLARLSLTAEERDLFARQLTAVLQYAEQLREVDTEGVAPTSHPLALSAPLRQDEARPSLPRQEALDQAPEADREAGLFKVPRVLGA
jgi:aspartyl-tRNA(Asn)/glutamyl-tRNA(Gln) amidotransferase subunit C